MRKLMLGGLMVLSVSSLPAISMAQETSDAAATTPDAAGPALTAEQKAIYDTWTVEEKNQYATWNPEYQAYFWTLTASQKKGYWMLTTDQRTQIYAMTPEQRIAAWSSIIAQLNGEVPATPPTQANPPGQGIPTDTVPTPESAAEPVPPAMPADESYQGGPYKGALTPPPNEAKEYPVCTKTLQDSCRNPGGK